MLLHQVDPVRRQLFFRRTSEEAVRRAAFIDGRTDIWLGEAVELPFSAAPDLERRPRTHRYIFHMSFCGSTLLARLLDRPGKVLSLKEPNCLVDLADWKTALCSGGSSDRNFGSVLQFAVEMLGRSWTDDEQVVIKPSSWANNLIAELLTVSDSRTVLVTIARDRFLEAVLRGGRDRLAFAARLAAHLSPFVADGGTILDEAIRSTDDPVGRAARLALVAHHIEFRLFSDASARGSGDAGSVDFADIESDPAGAALRAAEFLDLGLDRSDLEANRVLWAQENAKADAAYSGERRRSENEQVRAHYGELMDSGLEWAKGALGSP